MIRVLVAEDSVTTRELLVSILASDPEIQVIATAKDGVEAVELTKRFRPDVVTMDIQMPKMDGFEATKQIMMETPTPIVIVSANVDTTQVQVSMNALRAGALAVLAKPGGPAAVDFDSEAKQFIATIKSMSQVKVIRHWGRAPAQTRRAPTVLSSPVRIVAIAASTGGPAALETVLKDLPPDFAPPVLIVQHIALGFVQGLASWLNTSARQNVKVAVHGEPIRPRTIYIAPDDRHLGVSSNHEIALSTGPPIEGFRPSGTHLFNSVAEHFGPSAIAVILTGMGRDGVAGLHAVRRNGGLVIAQDEESSVVFGMPAAAISENLQNIILPLPTIASRLAALAQKKEIHA